MDVTTAFLHGELQDEIYMKQPEAYSNGSERVCRFEEIVVRLKASQSMLESETGQSTEDFWDGSGKVRPEYLSSIQEWPNTHRGHIRR